MAAGTAVHRYVVLLDVIVPVGLTVSGAGDVGSAISIRRLRSSLHCPYPEPFHVRTFQVATPACNTMPVDTLHVPVPSRHPASPGRYQRSYAMLSRSVR